ncbi:PUA-like domain-containing protein [Annulohypoxylon nitens]|nr:PUA-like domain-containing protein [Annulohypoxylon nitens]
MDPQYSMNPEIRRMMARYLGQPEPQDDPTPSQQGTVEQAQVGNQSDGTNEFVDKGAAATATNIANPPGLVSDVELAFKYEELPPMFKEGGIGYGIIVERSKTGRKTYQLNPYLRQKDAKVFGHNDIVVGAWFANRLIALVRGAHGVNIKGIHGSDQGAFSIVVANDYKDFNEDHGDRLFYSAANSSLSTDQQQPESSGGAKALKMSLETGLPVRVLRSGGAKSQNEWLPVCGIRYDGLYRVTGVREKTNAIGGLYEQFILDREPNQPPLGTIRLISPTPQEQQDFAEFKQL